MAGQFLAQVIEDHAVWHAYIEADGKKLYSEAFDSPDEAFSAVQREALQEARLQGCACFQMHLEVYV